MQLSWRTSPPECTLPPICQVTECDNSERERAALHGMIEEC